MGMFDDMKCERALPLPEDQGELAGRNWAEQRLQTKSFERMMEEYCIRADGTLWKQTYAWETARKGGPCRKTTGWVPLIGYTGAVSFYEFIYGTAHDYWVEWISVFVSGRITEIKLQCWERCDNSERLASEAKWRAECNRRERFLATWAGRRLYPRYAWLVQGCIGRPLDRFFRYVGRLCDRASLAAGRFTNKLAPYGDPVRAEHRRRALTEIFEDDTAGLATHPMAGCLANSQSTANEHQRSPPPRRAAG